MHSRWLVPACLCLSMLAIRPSRSAAQSIHIDEGNGSCEMPFIPPGGSGTAYIYCRVGGSAAAGGMIGAEFRITGLPAEMMATASSNPASNLVLGDPFGDGCNLAFPNCETGGFGIVLLYTVNLVAPSAGVPPYILTVERHGVPSNPTFPCPLVVLCDPPVFTKVCVSGGQSSPGGLLRLPSNPTPADVASNVAINTDLAWGLTGLDFCCWGAGPGHTMVHFGTSPAPPQVGMRDYNATTHDPGDLAPFTTYYWRIERVFANELHGCGRISSPVWSFRTGSMVGIEAATWHAVKGMFR